MGSCEMGSCEMGFCEMGFCEMGFCEIGFIDVSTNHVMDTIVIISFHDVLSFDMRGLFWFVVCSWVEQSTQI